MDLIPSSANAHSASKSIGGKKKQQLQDSLVALSARVTDVSSKLDSLEERYSQVAESLASIDARLSALDTRMKISDGMKSIQSEFVSVRQLLREIRGITKESLWSDVFDRSIMGSDWVETMPLSPGRAAIGFPCTYILFKALNIMQPKCILDIGLGQSTTMIGHYASSNEGVRHIAVEHDNAWIQHCRREGMISDKTDVIQLEVEMADISDCSHPVRVYKGFKEVLFHDKFDLILIDGPIGRDMKELSRIDVLEIVPESLASSFLIIVDDYNRKGEKNMVERLRAILDEAGIDYQEGAYSGEKTTLAIASADYSFMTTL